MNYKLLDSVSQSVFYLNKVGKPIFFKTACASLLFSAKCWILLSFGGSTLIHGQFKMLLAQLGCRFEEVRLGKNYLSNCSCTTTNEPVNKSHLNPSELKWAFPEWSNRLMVADNQSQDRQNHFSFGHKDCRKNDFMTPSGDCITEAQQGQFRK